MLQNEIPTHIQAWADISFCAYRKQHVITHDNPRETGKGWYVSTLTKEHQVNCKVHAHRFVVHAHELSLGAASLLEEHLRQRFAWLQSVWVDSDAPRQFTVRFDPDETFNDSSEIEQPVLSRQLIERTLRFITWNPDNTNVQFDDF